MNYDRFIKTEGIAATAGLFSAIGDFGLIDGNIKYDLKLKGDGRIYSFSNGKIELKAEFTEKNGGILRKDTFTNLTDGEITVNRLNSRFTMEGGEYQVYTQSNSWQRECVGRWQKFGPSISVFNQGVRTCDGATPVTAFYNEQTGKTVVFHLFPVSQWKITATRRVHTGLRDTVTVETGIEDSGLALKVFPKETIELPEIFFYECNDKTGLGSDILHEYFNENYPRKSLPLIYNTWLMNFDFLNYDETVRQVDTAAELGFEYFVIDAGWFGVEDKPWVSSVGDWEENTSGAFYGKMKDLSNYVKNKGLKFGLWMEPERATFESDAYKNNPEQFFSEYCLLDFANEKARERIFNVVCGLIEKYDLKFMKFDFNRTTPYDETQSGFYRYMQGQKKFVQAIKEKYPDVYLCNCASGGNRMDLSQAKLFDSFWISDNQGPEGGLRIYTDMIKRLPPCVIEKWNVQCAIKDVPGTDKKHDVMLSCNNADWTSIVLMDESYTFSFLKSGPIGYSCNIADFPNEYKKATKEYIEKYKKDREFFKSAKVKTLCNTENIVVLEYYDVDLKRCLIQFFSKLINQEELTVFPHLDGGDYLLNGNTVNGKEISENGYVFKDLKDNACQELEFIKA